jgi:hypothetical protein
MNPKVELLLTELSSTACHFKRLGLLRDLKERRVKTKVIEKATGIKDYQIRHYLRVELKLCPTVKTFFQKGSVTYSHAKVLASMAPEQQEKTARQIIAKGTSVHQLSASINANANVRLNSDLEKLADQYSAISGLDIKIKADREDGKAGVWSIRYTDLDMFDTIVEKIAGKEKADEF